MNLPREMQRSRDVAMLHDPEEGICFLIDYRRFINVFQYPWGHPGKKALEALVMGYLESESVSDLPFQRVAARFPRNFKKIIRSMVNIELGDPGNVEDLMMEFKPYTIQKFPRVVVTLVDKMARLSAR